MSTVPFNHRGSRSRGSGSRDNMPIFENGKLEQPTPPESENAVVSSEDEHEAVKSVASLNSQTGGPAFPKGARRSSFLSELQPDAKRKMSFTGFAGPSNGSQPPTPSADNGVNPWGSSFGSGLARVPSNGSATSWSAAGANIWNKSSSSFGQPLAPVRGHGEKSSSPLGVRDLEDLIPFAIPLHPTPKTYRSQSYSVGQMESEIEAAGARGRANPVPIKHKPSRLNEVEHAHTLDEVHEGDDEGSDAGVPLSSPRLQNPYLYGSGHTHMSDDSGEYALQRWSTLPAHVSQANFDDPFARLSQAGLGRTATQQSFGESELETLANRLGPQATIANRPHWQSSNRFDHMEDLSTSRRHSLADVPLNMGALSLVDNMPDYRDSQGNSDHQTQASNLESTMRQSDSQAYAFAQGYFSGNMPAARSQTESRQAYNEFSNGRGGFAGQHRQGPQPGVFNRPGYDTPLYIVAFKCARADIYYVAPGTGLEVNEGDLVMVEADRGYDLGTVTHARVSWAHARELKEKALDEHFRWLMMFSRHNQDLPSADPTAVHGMMAQTGPAERNPQMKAFGFGASETPGNHDIKPRMIKRKAHNWEIQNLREKEGNEAKAKRSCQQKAREHGCEMEILDAEFQIDWKKLTFYFYAPQYVNFNPLVTDLYKVYKVRIWMSAINPYTYPSPANKPPSTVGPGALEGRDTPMDQGISAFNDPDPDGALPPHLNPASATYKELNRETAGRGHASQDMPRTEYGRRYGGPNPQASFSQSPDPSQNRYSAGGNRSWDPSTFAFEAPQSHANDAGHHQAGLQATAGAQSQAWNPYATTFSSSQSGFNNYPGTFPTGGFNAAPGSFQPPGGFSNPASRDNPALPGLQSFSPGFSYSDWSRGSNNDFNKR